MLIILALLGVLGLGLVLGLCWLGAVLIGDRRALDRLSSQLRAEQRMQTATQDALAAMRATGRRHSRWPTDGSQP